MDRLIEGYRRYRETRWPELRALHRYLADNGQRPSYLVVACSDSRVDPATIFDMGPGELFVVRNVANLVPPYEQSPGYHGVSAAIEFAVEQLEVSTILVLGHAQCGGCAAALEAPSLRAGSFLHQWVSLLDSAKLRIAAAGADAGAALEYESIRVAIENLKTFPFVRDAMTARALRLEGAHYGVADGILTLLNQDTGAFVQIN